MPLICRICWEYNDRVWDPGKALHLPENLISPPLSDVALNHQLGMDFLTPPQSSPGPPAMDLEEPRDTGAPPQDPGSACPWDPVPESPGTPSHMELDGARLQDLVQQFEALPGTLVDLVPATAPCPLHIATGHGLAPPDSDGTHGLLSTEADREDLLKLLHGEKHPAEPEPPPEEPPDPAPRLLQPPEDLDRSPSPIEWGEGASAERESDRSSNSSPEAWLETVPLVTPEEPPVGAQVEPAPTHGLPPPPPPLPRGPL